MLSNGYILILIWGGVIAALAVMAPEWVYRTELVNGEKVRRVTPLFAVVAATRSRISCLAAFHLGMSIFVPITSTTFAAMMEPISPHSFRGIPSEWA